MLLGSASLAKIRNGNFGICALSSPPKTAGCVVCPRAYAFLVRCPGPADFYLWWMGGGVRRGAVPQGSHHNRAELSGFWPQTGHTPGPRAQQFHRQSRSKATRESAPFCEKRINSHAVKPVLSFRPVNQKAHRKNVRITKKFREPVSYFRRMRILNLLGQKQRRPNT